MAIKRYREVTGVGLKEAKDAIDARADAMARRR
nr:ribosomal protein L7/L12 [Nannocystis sp. SCPEA4]